ncbi:MAG: hypothetical protein U5L72_06750 [Bacteroidales bacterium]|nr:hypothetical protein [Bacteroidales bacterium]
MRRLIYLGYYIKKLERKKFLTFLEYVNATRRISRLKLLVDVLLSSLKYNISLLEYFQFRFYEIRGKDRKTWAGTGYMYEYQRIMNPPGKRVILDDKTMFYRKYGEFMRHTVADIEDLKRLPDLADRLLTNPSGRLVFKVYNGKCGQQVVIMSVSDIKSKGLLSFMTANGYDIVEEYIMQHKLFMELSPRQLILCGYSHN